MRIKFLFSICLISLVAFASATDISFVVYFAQGTATKNGKLKLKKGDTISSTESISLTDKASVMLICSNYKVIQLNKKGTYTAKNLLSQCNKDVAGYSSSYFKYVWNEFTHPHGKLENNPGEYMKNVGAVSRGCNMLQTALAVDSLHLYAGTLPIQWTSSFNQAIWAVYEVSVDGAPIQKKLLDKKEPIRIEQLTRDLLPGEYYWTVVDAEGNGCERNYLKLWSPLAYTNKLKELLGSIPVTSPAETAFAKAFVLHENHFLAEALKYYTIASRLSPKNKLYQTSLSQFYAPTT
ncbi:MAG: hypothetical protein EOO13_09515 [Chitinophagaceae bacterium]|nr:MAG: hypothetical protein EOO13_09515 [Chitinophagaceae bacterium]